jgi:hypothetical protein
MLIVAVITKQVIDRGLWLAAHTERGREQDFVNKGQGTPADGHVQQPQAVNV